MCIEIGKQFSGGVLHISGDTEWNEANMDIKQKLTDLSLLLISPSSNYIIPLLLCHGFFLTPFLNYLMISREKSL